MNGVMHYLVSLFSTASRRRIEQDSSYCYNNLFTKWTFFILSWWYRFHSMPLSCWYIFCMYVIYYCYNMYIIKHWKQIFGVSYIFISTSLVFEIFIIIFFLIEHQAPESWKMKEQRLVNKTVHSCKLIVKTIFV